MNGLPLGILSTAYTSTPLTIYSGINYTTTALAVTTSTITFSGPGPFFIRASTGDITLTEVVFALTGGATPNNIFWLTENGAFTITDTGNDMIASAIPGIFIAPSGTGAFTFSGFAGSDRNLNGAIYTNTAITLTETLTINTNNIPTADICFPADTPVTTDQGEIPIGLMDANVQTMNGNRIVAVTRTVAQSKYLVSFKKDSLGENPPQQRYSYD